MAGPQRRLLSEQEYEGIRQGLIAKAPANLDEANFERWFTSRFAQALAEAEYSPAPVTGSALSRFGSNLAEGLNPKTIVQGLWRAGTHPIETAGQMWEAQTGQWDKAKERAGEGRYVEAGGHALASLLPIVGPAAAAAGEQIAGGDIAGGLGSGTAVAAPFGVAPAVRGLGRVAGAVVPQALRDAAAAPLEAGVRARVSRTISPQVGGQVKVRMGNMADKVANELMQQPGTGRLSRVGLQDVAEKNFALAADQLDAVSDARLAGRPIPTKPIIDALEAQKAELIAQEVEGSRITPSLRGPGGRPVPVGTTQNVVSGRYQPRLRKGARPIGEPVTPGPNLPQVAMIDQAIDEIRRLGTVAHYEPLRVMRQAYDQVAKLVYSPSITADFAKVEGARLGAADITGTLRRVLAEADPETAVANAQYHLWKTTRDVLKATEEVERVRPRVGRAILARLTGALAGGEAAGLPGMAVGYLGAPLVDSALSMAPTTQLLTAKLMQTLASAIRSGDMGAVEAILSKIRSASRVAQPASITGRTTSPNESPAGLAELSMPASTR